MKIIISALVLVAIAQLVYSVSQRATYTLRIVNNSAFDIQELHLAWSGSGRWSPDVLGKQVLRSRSSFIVQGVSAGDYDILFVYTNGHRCVGGPVSVYANVTWVLTDRNCRPI